MKRKSVFQNEYWLEKGYTEEESIYQVKSRRPFNVEYWMKKHNVDYDQGVLLLKQFQRENSEKSNKKYTKQEKRKYNSKCVEYWLEKGYTEEESKKIISHSQSTFSYKKCVEKYGEEKGKIIFDSRNEKWLKSLNENNDMDLVNKEKCSINFNRYDNIDNFILDMKEKRNMDLVKTLDELTKKIESDLLTNPEKQYMYVSNYIEKHIQKSQIEIIGNYNNIELSISHLFKPSDVFLVKKGNKQAYRKWVGTKLLRSSHEILFYDLLCKYNLDCEIDGYYPNSKMRFDFRVNGKYIEIAPMYNMNESYAKKMDLKNEKFDSYILHDSTKYEEFIMENLI